MRRLAFGVISDRAAVRGRAGARAARHSAARRKDRRTRKAARCLASRSSSPTKTRASCAKSPAPRKAAISPRRWCRAAIASRRSSKASRRSIAEALTLTVGQTTSLDLTMEVGGTRRNAHGHRRSAAGRRHDRRSRRPHLGDELSDLPAASRNYMAFVGNVPGTVFIPSAEFLNDSFQANGQPTAANNIVFDGANNTDEQRGSNVGGQTRASNESIQEVQILTNQFDAEWGRASGAVINAVTKSGTNQFTGLGVQLLHEQGDDEHGLLREGQGRREAGRRQEGMGRHDRRTDRAEQAALLRQPRAARTSTATSATPSRRGPSLNFAIASEESAWNTLWRIDHQLSTSTRGRSAGCARARRSSTGSTAARKR